MARRKGNPYVHAVMNVVLSTVFAAVAVWGLSVIGVTAFTPRNVIVGAAVIAAVTFVVVR